MNTSPLHPRRCAAAALLAASIAPWQPAQAESLRCNGQIAAEGDSRLSVLYKCGQPTLADSYCAPLYAWGAPYPLPLPLAGTLLPCQPVEEWLYERGPGNLPATVRLRYGVVQSISYARSPTGR